MRNNQPVTQHGYMFQPDQTLVSVTDLKGRITYCNTSFADVSNSMRLFCMAPGEFAIAQSDAVETRRERKLLQPA